MKWSELMQNMNMTLTSENERRLSEILREYSKKAVPMNYAFRKYYEFSGDLGDYQDSDAGEPPSGAKW